MSSNQDEKDFISSIISKGKEVSIVLNESTGLYDVESKDLSSGETTLSSLDKVFVDRVLKEIINNSKI